MVTNDIMRIGIVTEVLERENNKGVVLFTIPKYVDEGIAYSLFKEKVPEKDDEIMLFRMNSNLGSLWYYLNISQKSRLSFNVNNNSIKVTQTGDIITASSNRIVDNHNNIDDNYTLDKLEFPDDFRVLYRPLQQLLNYLFSALFRMKIQNPDGTISTVSPVSLNDFNILKNQINKIKDPQSWVIYPTADDGTYNKDNCGIDSHTIDFS